MNLPDYVPADEVKRVCRELKIRDWSTLTRAEVLPEEAQIILSAIDTGSLKVNPDDFRQGLEVELEHGTRYPDANVTNNHPILTGKIVLAHLKESLDYYRRLDIAELEGDLLKALIKKDLPELARLHKKLAEARLVLCQTEAAQLSKA